VDVKTDWPTTENVAEVSPPATVTLTGIESPAGELEKLTTAPPEGAGPVSVTVPAANPPVDITVGVSVTPDRVAPGGFTVTLAVLFRPR
jgi:hypothetical protein